MKPLRCVLPVVGLLIVGVTGCVAEEPAQVSGAQAEPDSLPTTDELLEHAPPPPETTGAQPAPPAPSSKFSAAAGTFVGATSYPVPADAIVVSPSGSDGNPGTSGAPLRSVKAAVSKAGSGRTIVLRAGTYHESIDIPSNKRLTIQNWPKEAAWFDGSVPLTGWTAEGGKWRKDGWTAEFDASPTFKKGAKDNTADGWGFVDPAFPMAPHPDQVWIDGVLQKQVASLDKVGAGTFFHDKGANRLWVGSNPSGKDVRASEMQRAIAVRSANSILRGFGVRRYAPSVPDMGSVTLEEAGIEAEHLAIADSATTGIFTNAANIKLRNLHVVRSGMLGVLGFAVDGLVAERMLVEHNNVESFNESPSAGGMKVTSARNLTARNNIFRSNKGTGLWFDEEAYNMTIAGNEMRNNGKHGISLEISAKAVVVNNFITSNSGSGIKVNNTSDVAIWNNTLAANDRSLWLVQDKRRPTSASTAGRDKRQPFPDPTMTWRLGPIAVRNNILANQKSGNCMLCVEDHSKERTAEQIGVTTNSDIFNRPNASTPKWIAVWAKGAASQAVFASLAAFRSATGQASAATAVDGAPVVDKDGKVVGNLPAASTAQPLPAAVANVAELPANSKAHGAVPR